MKTAELKKLISSIAVILIFCGIIIYHIFRFVSPPKAGHFDPNYDPEPYLGRYGDPH